MYKYERDYKYWECKKVHVDPNVLFLYRLCTGIVLFVLFVYVSRLTG